LSNKILNTVAQLAILTIKSLEEKSTEKFFNNCGLLLPSVPSHQA